MFTEFSKQKQNHREGPLAQFYKKCLAVTCHTYEDARLIAYYAVSCHLTRSDVGARISPENSSAVDLMWPPGHDVRHAIRRVAPEIKIVFIKPFDLDATDSFPESADLCTQLALELCRARHAS